MGLEIHRFEFTPNEITENSKSKQAWHKFVRSSEVKHIFGELAETQIKNALEIGAGDGIQSNIASQYCEKYTCTYYSDDEDANHGKIDQASSNNKIKYIKSDAHDLKIFPEKSFDLIYSSNVLEHLSDIRKALFEFNRVLTDDGCMIHVMPNRTWKLSSFFFNMLLLTPHLKVHGVAKNHFQEFYLFGIKRWLRTFQRAGYNIFKIIKMPYYPGTQNRISSITKLGNKLGLSSSAAFYMKKKI